LTVPENATSLALIEIGALVVEIEVETALVTFPSAEIVTPVGPVTLALSVTAPLEPDDVCKTTALPDRACEAVIVPLPVSVRVPFVEVIAPLVPMVAEAPVVVMERLPPTVEVPSVTAPVLLI
jgi:hypothetical protein